MRFPWLALIFSAIVIGGAVFAWFYYPRKVHRSETRGWVAHTGFVRSLAQYQMLVRRSRFLVGAVVGAFALTCIGGALSVGAPVERKLTDDKLASRDIVLCLDASGSMLPYDDEIGRSFNDIISHFSGERIALNLWSARSIVKFPLTDDYVMATEVLTEMSRILKKGYYGQAPDGQSVLISQEVVDYLEGTYDPAEKDSSLIGDGLASCVLGFDHMDESRSRTIILATDNEVLGKQIYSLADAITFAQQHSVTVIALYPGSTNPLSANGAELKELVESTGGTFYDASDPASVDGIIDDIESQQQKNMNTKPRVVETDRPTRSAQLAAVGLLLLLGAVASVRL